MWRFSTNEYWVEILEDLLFLIKHGYDLWGVTSDGKSGLVWSVKELSRILGREIIHQRCLVHIQLQAQRFITQRPKTEAGKRLLENCLMLNQIRSQAEKRIWTLWLARWGERYGEMLREKTREESGHWWYTHRYLRRAYRSLVPTESFFSYLDHPGLPKDTNGIEGTFSQLDGNIARHRGLSQGKKEALIAYRFVFKEFPNYLPKTNT